MGDLITHQYGITRVQKVKAAAVGAMQYHNDRLPGEHSNEDIDPERSRLNRELVPHGDYADEVAGRIARFRKSDRKVRKDAVVLCEGIATASPEFFEGLTAEQTNEFFDDVFAFVRNEAGAENLIHFTVHMDETTPHAHFGFTPIKDGSLSWKKYFDGKNALRAFQDRYWEQVGKKWGLERGEKTADQKPEERRKHKSTQQMKRDSQRELRDLESAVEQKRQQSVELDNEISASTERLEGLQQEIEDVQPAAVTLPESVRALVSGRSDGERERELAAEKAELGAGIGELERQIEEARGRIGELERGLPALRGRCERARERFELVERRVSELIGRLREVPETLSAWALDIANKLGKRTYNPNSLDYQMRRATEVARAMNASREWQPRQRRDWGAR